MEELSHVENVFHNYIKNGRQLKIDVIENHMSFINTMVEKELKYVIYGKTILKILEIGLYRMDIEMI